MIGVDWHESFYSLLNMEFDLAQGGRCPKADWKEKDLQDGRGDFSAHTQREAQIELQPMASLCVCRFPAVTRRRFLRDVTPHWTTSSPSWHSSCSGTTWLTRGISAPSVPRKPPCCNFNFTKGRARWVFLAQHWLGLGLCLAALPPLVDHSNQRSRQDGQGRQGGPTGCASDGILRFEERHDLAERPPAIAARESH